METVTYSESELKEEDRKRLLHSHSSSGSPSRQRANEINAHRASSEVGKGATMFRKSLVLRFRYLYVIQTLLEVQRQFNVWCSRLKHKIAYLLHRRRLQLDSIRAKLINGGKSASYHEQYEAGPHPAAQNYLGGQFLIDSSRMLASNLAGVNSVTIPFQMLLLPFIPTPAGSACAIQMLAPAARDHHTNSAENNDRCLTHQSSVCGVQRTGTSFSNMTPDRSIGAQNASTPLPVVSDFRSFLMSEQSRRQAPNSSRRCHNNQQTEPLTWFAGSATRDNDGGGGGGGRTMGIRSCAMSLRNPLACFPSTSNHESGRVKYM